MIRIKYKHSPLTTFLAAIAVSDSGIKALLTA